MNKTGSGSQLGKRDPDPNWGRYLYSDLEQAKAVGLLVVADVLNAGKAGRHLLLRVQTAPEAHVLRQQLGIRYSYIKQIRDQNSIVGFTGTVA